MKLELKSNNGRLFLGVLVLIVVASQSAFAQEESGNIQDRLQLVESPTSSETHQPNQATESGIQRNVQSPGSSPELSKTHALAVPRRENSSKSKSDTEHQALQSLPWKEIGTKLGIVVGIFVVFMIVLSGRKKSASIPREAVDVLGRIPFNGKQTLQLIKFGQKLVLMESSDSGLKAISEITDPAEVRQLMETIRGSA